MKIKRFIGVLLSGVLLLTCAGCGNASAKDNNNSVIKVGINGEDNLIWKSVRSQLEKEGVKLETVSFSDYIIPNTALVDGEIDANAFQTEIFFNSFVKESKADLSVAAYTVSAPMGIYPGKVKDLTDLPDNAKIAIPNDSANGGRALVLLQDAGLIKLDESKGILPTVKDIIENQKNIEIVELVPAMIPTSIEEFDVACINNGVAKEAGLFVSKDAIFTESIEKDYMKNYFNIIAVQTKNLESDKIKKLVKAYQSEETKKAIVEEYNGNGIPAFRKK